MEAAAAEVACSSYFECDAINVFKKDRGMVKQSLKTMCVLEHLIMN